MNERTSFYLPEDASGRLRAIQARTWFEGPANVIRTALSAFEELLELDAAGYRLTIQTRTGEERTHKPFCRIKCVENQGPGNDEQGPPLPKNLFFPAEISNKVNTIRHHGRLSSNSDVLRIVIAAFDDMTRMVLAGDQLIVHGKDGKTHPYNPFVRLKRSEFPGLQALEQVPMRRRAYHRSKRPREAVPA